MAANREDHAVAEVGRAVGDLIGIDISGIVREEPVAVLLFKIIRCESLNHN